MKKYNIPLTVSKNKKNKYLENYKIATLDTGKLFIFAGDQKVEHLNDDFYGPNIALENANPSHLFNIASESKGLVLATQMGLIANYGNLYKDVPYLIKINSKTHLNKNKSEAISSAWYDIDDVLRFEEQSNLNIIGIGYTIYLGSKYEHIMLKEAAQLIYKAHQAGLLAVIWAYTRNSSIKNENDIHLVAGAAGVAACLGADFAKVNYPYQAKNQKKAAHDYKEVTMAAGLTKILCVGGSMKNAKSYLSHLHNQLNISNTKGVAIGRNIHQRSLKDAIRFSQAVSSLVFHNQSLKDANLILEGKKKLSNKKASKEKNFLNIF